MSSPRIKNKKSLIVLIATSFWMLYVGLTSWQYYNSAKIAAQAAIDGRRETLTYVVASSVQALMSENIPLLESQLKQSRELFLSDFYILQKNGTVVSHFNFNGNAELLNRDYTIFNRMIETDKLSFKTIKVFDYTLTVGIITNRKGVILNILKRDYLLIFKDIAMVTLSLSALLYLFLKDIINISKILSSKDRSQLQNVNAMSREGRTLLKASLSFDSSQENLKGVNEHYSNTITPAILHEIKSGRSAPYSFESTMIRIDLNGYTQIFLDKREEYITTIMNSYFTQAREVIERYGGLIYQYVGDEIVFHIKDTHQNSQSLAMACIRSLFEVAENIEKNLPADADHYFKVKSCMAPGKMRFANLDTGYSLSGLSLIETARLLTQIEDKSKSSVCFYLEAYRSFNFLCDIENHSPALFKGFQNQTEVARTSTFKDVNNFIDTQDFKKLMYFRSDNDLSTIFKFFAQTLSMENEGDFFIVAGFLKGLTIKTTSCEMVDAFTALLAIATTRNRERWLSDKALSTVIALTGNLVPHSMVTGDILDLLNESLNHADHRTCANTILVLGDLSKDHTFLREFIHSSNNRISADAMLVAGKRSFDFEVAKKLESFLVSKNPLYYASGIFVAKQLVTHFQTKDPVYFETNEQLQRIANLIPADRKHAA